METCATHGLRYDPAIHDGCVLCRGAAGGERVGVPTPRRAARTVFIALAICGVGAGTWVASRALDVTHVSSSACAKSCARESESCFAGCRGQAGESCSASCIAPTHDCLARCEELNVTQLGEFRLAYSAGRNAPDWASLKGPPIAAPRGRGKWTWKQRFTRRCRRSLSARCAPR
jgi:hypothetical protein